MISFEFHVPHSHTALGKTGADDEDENEDDDADPADADPAIPHDYAIHHHPGWASCVVCVVAVFQAPKH